MNVLYNLQSHFIVQDFSSFLNAIHDPQMEEMSRKK